MGIDEGVAQPAVGASLVSTSSNNLAALDEDDKASLLDRKGGQRPIRERVSNKFVPDTPMDDEFMKKCYAEAESASEPKRMNAPTPHTLAGSCYTDPNHKYTLDPSFAHLSKGATCDLYTKKQNNQKVKKREIYTLDNASNGVKQLYRDFLSSMPDNVRRDCGIFRL